jgi:hypothetical protein
MNVMGIVAMIFALAESQLLDFRDPSKAEIGAEGDLDMMLLRFCSIFTFLYLIFVIITGSFHDGLQYYKTLNVTFGVVSMVQVVLQIALIYNLKNRVSSKIIRYVFF